MAVAHDALAHGIAKQMFVFDQKDSHEGYD
jgi:hypothetical protein